MGDLGVHKPHMLIARRELEIDSDELVIEGKEVRLLELDEEQHNVESDIESALARAGEFEVKAKAVQEPQTSEARRLLLRAHEQHNSIQAKKYRLLELDEEREQVRGDIEASRAHIETLQREVAQQRARKAEQETK